MQIIKVKLIFKKKFDSIDWDFISETLRSVNFSLNMINWMKSSQINLHLYIIQNGHVSQNRVAVFSLNGRDMRFQ